MGSNKGAAVPGFSVPGGGLALAEILNQHGLTSRFHDIALLTPQPMDQSSSASSRAALLSVNCLARTRAIHA